MRNNISSLFSVVLVLTLAASGAARAGEDNDRDSEGHPDIQMHLPSPYARDDHPSVERPGGFAGGFGGSGRISYHGGPVMGGTPSVYVIWYGFWSDAQKGIIRDFLRGLGGSPYFNINKTYSISGKPVSGLVNFGGDVASTYVGPSLLSDQDIQNIVVASGPMDLNGVYFVLTGSDVRKSGFCTSYCGWHTYGNLNLGKIKFSFVGNPVACPLVGAQVGNCAVQTVTSPNGDVGVDALVSVLAHELEEAVTDPELNAWFDSRGYENADKCAWTYGTTYNTVNGAYANMALPTGVPLVSRHYLIQRNWVNANGGYCALK